MQPIIDLLHDEVVGFEFSHAEVAAIRELLDDLVLADQQGLLIRYGDNPNEYNPYYQAITGGWWKVAMAVDSPYTETIPVSPQAATEKSAERDPVDTDNLE
jgi:hypothetical protein